MTPFEVKLHDSLKATPRQTYAELINLLWPGAEDTQAKRLAVKVHVCTLNKQIAPQRVKAIRKIGYELVTVDSQHG
jgi:DNA-binding response OmpR family regulator